VVTVETRPVSTREGEKIFMSVRYQTGGDDLLVFLHGLGCAKESFDGAFAAEPLARYSLLTLDLPAHGDTSSTGSSADIAGAAEIVTSLLGGLSWRRLYLICHSMGGAIGLVAAQDLPRFGGFISVEGNLVAGDCGLVSRGIAVQRPEEFEHEGFDKFVDRLERSTEPSHSEWAKWYRRCNRQGLHGLASSLVDWCDSDKLIGILQSLGRSAYVHGEQSDVRHLLDRLGSVPVHSVAGSGHFPMLDNPEDFYSMISGLVDGFATAGTPVVSAERSV